MQMPPFVRYGTAPPDKSSAAPMSMPHRRESSKHTGANLRAAPKRKVAKGATDILSPTEKTSTNVDPDYVFVCERDSDEFEFV